MTLDLFVDAINTRTSPQMSAWLKACDIICVKSIEQLYAHIPSVTIPPVLTYIDKGLGGFYPQSRIKTLGRLH
ncbi:MAG: hypothetical protein HC912_13140 [Saprospiraceae bacterium]|nr:hypothetical protein [Saprospiraceae bacterium]